MPICHSRFRLAFHQQLQTRTQRVIAVLIALAVISGPPSPTFAQTAPIISMEAGYFKVSSQPRFLIFVSYFDALDVAAGALESDLAFLRAKGFDGIRIFPNWWTSTDPGVYAGDTVVCENPGSPGCATAPIAQPAGYPPIYTAFAVVRIAELNALENVVARAAAHNLLVEVAFSAETVADGPSGYGYLSVPQNQEAIRAVAYRLRGYGNVLFDLQNEHNIVGGACNGNEPFSDPNQTRPCRHALTPSSVVTLRTSVDDVSPWRLTTASTSEAAGEVETAIRVRDSHVDIAAYHTPRVPGWWDNEGNRVHSLRSQLAAHGVPAKPIYLNEPEPLGPGRHVQTGQQLINALRNAKAAGAAGWCFHTEASFVMNGSSLQDRLSAQERYFVDNFRAQADATAWGMPTGGVTSMTFQTIANPAYVVAESGGGQVINANRPSASLWETFTLIDRTGGELLHGDIVSLRTWDGVHYVSALNGGGASISSYPTYMGPWETFTIERIGGAGPGTVIRYGDQVAIRTQTGHYFGAVNGGGGGTTADRWPRGLSETFIFRAVQ